MSGTRIAHAHGPRLPDPILGPAVLEGGEGTKPLLYPEERGAGLEIVRPGIEWLPARRSRRLPEMWLQVAAEAAERTPELCEQWMPSPPAEAAERDAIPAMASWQDVEICAARLPEMRLDEAAATMEAIPEPCEQWMPGPRADAAVRDAIPAMACERVGSCATRLPQMRLAIAPTAIEPIADFRQQELCGTPAPTAMADERAAQACAARLPEMRLEAAAEALEQIPELCEQWMPSPPAEAVEREAIPAMASQCVPSCAARLPQMRLTVGPTTIGQVPGFRQQQLSNRLAAIAAMANGPDGQPAAQNGAARLPQVRLELVKPTVAQIPELCEQWMPSPGAEAAEREAIAAMASQRLESCGARLPEMRLEAATPALEQIPELCEQWMPSPGAEAAEREVIAAMASQRLESCGARLPEMRLEAATPALEPIPELCEQWMPSPGAEAAEREAIAAMASQRLESCGARLPEMRLEAATPALEQIPELCEQWMPSPGAEAAEREVIAAMASQRLESCGACLPEMRLEAATPTLEQIPELCEQGMPSQAADAAEREVIAATASQCVESCGARLPEMRLEAATPTLDHVPDFRQQQLSSPPAAVAAMAAGPGGDPAAQTGAARDGARLPEMRMAVAAEPIGRIPEECEQPMPCPQAEAAECDAIPAMAQAYGAVPGVRTAGWEFPIATHVPITGQWRRAEGPQAAVVRVQSRFRTIPLAALRYPSLAELQPIADGVAKSRPAHLAAPVAGIAGGPLAACPVESMPATAGFVAVAVPFADSLRLPALSLSEIVAVAPSGYDAVELVRESVVRAPRTAAPAGTGERGDSAIPKAGFAALDFYCETGAGAPVERCEWAPSTAPLALPDLSLRPVADQKEDASAVSPIRPLVPLLRALRKDVAAHLGVAAKIAACLMVVTSLWLGGRMLRELHSVSLSAKALEAPPVDSRLTDAEAAEQSHATGPLASVRRALARRAAVEVTDTFSNGMQAWGAAPNTMVKGWSRDEAGYVRPGETAVFRPTLGYKDYRFEFFGLIESKSLGWMVRARDDNNYYAMKFTTLEAGLRPIISVAHYPVVGGQQGHRVDVPLNVMVHNNTPYHVAVEVRGNRVITSIEGQEVDSWTDDALLASGGVGFFSEAGARARLYWMKVFKNDDMLGRICAYLAGPESGANTAELRRPGLPAGPRRPTSPAPRPEAVWAVAALGGSSSARRARTSNRRREEPWS